jgi:hypothetical protein
VKRTATGIWYNNIGPWKIGNPSEYIKDGTEVTITWDDPSDHQCEDMPQDFREFGRIRRGIGSQPHWFIQWSKDDVHVHICIRFCPFCGQEL